MTKQINNAKIARTVFNKELRTLRHNKRMEQQCAKIPSTPRGTARIGRVKKAPLSFQIDYTTALRNGFDNIHVLAKPSPETIRIAGLVIDAITAKFKAGVYKVNSVSINLTHQTAKRLNAPHYDVKDFNKAAMSTWKG